MQSDLQVGPVGSQSQLRCAALAANLARWCCRVPTQTTLPYDWLRERREASRIARELARKQAEGLGQSRSDADEMAVYWQWTLLHELAPAKEPDVPTIAAVLWRGFLVLLGGVAQWPT